MKFQTITSFRRRLIPFKIFIISSCILFIACGSDETDIEDNTISQITIMPDDEDIVALNQQAQLYIVATNANGDELSTGTISWSSNDDNILSVSPDGIMTALAVGSASINASTEGVSAKADFTVIDLTGKWVGGEFPDTVCYTLVQSGTDVTGTFDSRLGFPPITDVTSGQLTGSIIFSRYDHELELTTETGCVMRVSGPHFARIEGGELILSPGSGSISSPNCNLNGTINFATLRRQ